MPPVKRCGVIREHIFAHACSAHSQWQKKSLTIGCACAVAATAAAVDVPTIPTTDKPTYSLKSYIYENYNLIKPNKPFAIKFDALKEFRFNPSNSMHVNTTTAKPMYVQLEHRKQGYICAMICIEY